MFISGAIGKYGKPLDSESNENILKTYNRVLGERKPPLKGKTKIIRIKDDTSK